MRLDLYEPGGSLLHRAPAGVKLLGLALAGLGVFAVSPPLVLGLLAGGLVAVFAAAGLPLRTAWRQIRMLIVLIAIFGIIQALFDDAALAATGTLRAIILVGLALLVTMTTPLSAMVDAVERAAAPLRHLGADPAIIALALAMALRSIPLLVEEAQTIRAAQAARGAGGHGFWRRHWRSLPALIVPLVVRVLIVADAMAAAIDARGFASRMLPQERPPAKVRPIAAQETAPP